MAFNPWAQYSLPTLGDSQPQMAYNPLVQAAMPSIPAAPPPPTNMAPQPGQATGQSNWLTAGLGAGAYEALGQLGSAGQAIAKLAGSDTFAQQAADFAARQNATAQTYARQDLEDHPWSPAGMAYQITKGLPAMAGFIGAGALGAAAAPEEAVGAGIVGGARLLGLSGKTLGSALGAGAAALPLSVGSNVQASEADNGPLTQAQAAKAIALGLPEAAVQSFLPARLEGMLAKGVSGGLMSEVGKAAGINAGVAGATQALTSLMGDPNRSFADRAQDVVSAALSGGFQGAVFGGAVHALSKMPPAQVTTESLRDAVDATVSPQTGTALVDPNAGPSPMTGGRQVVPASSVAVEPYEAQNTALTDPRSTPPAPPSNALPGPSPDAAQLPPPDVRPLVSKSDEDLLRAQQHYAANPPEDEQNTRLQQMINFEIKTRLDEARRATPALEDQTAIRMPDQSVPPGKPSLVTPDVINAGPPEDMPTPKVNPFAGTPDVDLIKQDANFPGDPDVQQEMGTRVSDDTRAAMLDTQIRKAAQTGKALPKFLQGETFTDPDAFRQRLAQEIQSRIDNNKPLGIQIERLDQEFNVTDANGKPLPELLTGGEAAPNEAAKAANSDVPEPNRPSVDAIPEKHQSKYVDLEKMRNEILGQNIPDKMGLMSQVDDLQTKLASPKQGEVAQIVKQTKAVRAEIDGAKAATDRVAATEPVAKAAAPATEVTQPSPQAQVAAAKIKAKREQAAAPAPEAPAPKEPPPKTQAEAKARKAASQAPKAPSQAPAPEAPAQVNPAFNPLKAKLDAAKAALGRVMSEGKLKTDAKTPNAMFQKDMSTSSDHLAQVEKAMRTGKPEAMRAFRKNYIDIDLYANHYDNADEATQKLLDAHAEADADVQDELQRLKGEMPSGVETKLPRTQADVDLEHLINNGASGKDLLDHIARNGSSGDLKEMAAKLSASGVNPAVRFASPDKVKFDNDRITDPKLALMGSYNPAFDRVNIYDRSDMERTMVHEAAHAATQKAINSNSPAAREIKALYEKLRETDGYGHYGLTNPHEMVAEAFSNPKFRDFLKGEKAYTGSTIKDMWQAFKGAVSKLLGFGDKTRTAFDQIMDTSGRLMKESLTKGFDSGNPMVIDQSMHESFAELPRVRDSYAEGLKQEVRGAKINLTTKAREVALKWLTTNHIADTYGDRATALRDIVAHMQRASAYSDSLAKPLKAASNMAHELPKKARANLDKVMAHTIQNMDLGKTWEKNTWLHAPDKATPKQLAQVQRLKDAHAAGQKYWNELKRDPQAFKTYEALRAANETASNARLAYLMHDLVSRDYAGQAINGFDITKSPFEDYNTMHTLHDDPVLAAQHFKSMVDAMHKGLSDYATTLKSKIDDMKTPDADRKAARALRSPVNDMLRDVSKAIAASKEGPYFHLGREGKYFVAAKLKMDQHGLPDDASLAKVQDALDKAGFGDVALHKGAENSSVYFKVRDPAEMERARDVMHALHDAGHLDKETPVSNGPSDDIKIYRSLAPSWMRRAIEAIRETKPEAPEGSSDQQKADFAAAHDQQIREMTKALMNMLPENSLTRVYQRREGVQGFSADMLKSFDEGAVSNARGLGGMAVASDMGKSVKMLQDQVHGINSDRTLTANQQLAYNQAAAETMIRDGNRNWTVPSTGLDTLRGLTHAVQIGMSPAYFVTLMTQIPSLSLPELGKSHGFLNSARALAANTPMTFKIAKAVFDSHERTGFGLREDALRKAGIPESKIKFIMDQAARGSFNQGSYTNSMVGHHASGTGKVSTAIRAMSAMSLYAEMIPRVMTALAAKDLYRGAEKDGELHDFVAKKVENSQMDWNPAFNARAVTKHGAFGGASPLINQFMGFQIRMTQTLYRNVAEAVAGGDPKTRAEAQKFLAGHLAAVTAFAGTLGLPMAGVAASVFDRLADWATGKDDWDVVASYRTYLAHTFGKDVGEMIARGAPRGLGVDLDRAGESNIVPGSTSVMVLTEKRKMEDAEKDWLKSMTGSAVGVGFNYLSALRDFGNGDYMNALVKIAPEGLKNLAEGAQLGTRGYVDAKGNKLPITASAEDILLKSVGIDPAKEEEYNEVKRVGLGLKTLAQVRSQNITRHMVLAMNRHDPASFRAWAAEAQTYARDHLGMSSPLQGLTSALSEGLQQQSLARALGTPLGVSPRDIIGRGMTSFGNFNGQ